MEMLDNLGLGIETALRLENLLWCFVGVVLGHFPSRDLAQDRIQPSVFDPHAARL